MLCLAGFELWSKRPVGQEGSRRSLEYMFCCWICCCVVYENRLTASRMSKTIASPVETRRSAKSHQSTTSPEQVVVPASSVPRPESTTSYSNRPSDQSSSRPLSVSAYFTFPSLAKHSQSSRLTLSQLPNGSPAPISTLISASLKSLTGKEPAG